jgi:IS30 family transposase
VVTIRQHAAQARAHARRPGPKTSKIATEPELRQAIQDGLDHKWSPEQIVRRLRRDFPDRPEMHVVHETIYQALYVLGKDNRSAIGTLVERATRYVMLVHLPLGRTPILVRDALIDTIGRLPTHLRRSLTGDQGSEMHLHHEFSLASDIPVYFCDPHSPWQRGSNENTNGLLRQYFPESTDLSVHNRDHLDAVAELNGRPRKTLGWDTPAGGLPPCQSTGWG